jgi:hypothetical protein
MAASEVGEQGFEPHHISGRRGLEAQGFAGDWMDEA